MPDPSDPEPSRPRAEARAGTFRSFGIRNFRLFFAGQLVSQVGNWLTLIAQTLLVLELTESGAALGVLAAAQFGPVLLLGAFAGLVADRNDKRRLLLVVQTAAMLQSFALGALAFLPDPPLAGVYALAVVGGVTLALDNPARRALVVEIVPERDITNAVSLNSALMTGARVVGPALGGVLVATVGFGWAFIIDGLSYLAVLGALWLMDPAAIRRSPPTPRGKGQVREGIRYARSIPEVWVPLVMMAVIGVLAFNFPVTLPLLTTRDLGGSDVTFTLLYSVVSIGSLAGALLAARRTDVQIPMVSWAALSFAVSMALLALAPAIPAAFVVAVFVGLSSITFMTTSTAIVQLRAAPTMRGRVLALQAMVFLGSAPVGGPIVGVVSEHFGARWGLLLGAVGAGAAAAYGFLARRSSARVGQPVPPLTPTVSGGGGGAG